MFVFQAAIGDAELGGFILPSQRTSAQNGDAGSLARLPYLGVQVETRPLPLCRDLNRCHGYLLSSLHDVAQVASVCRSAHHACLGLVPLGLQVSVSFLPAQHFLALFAPHSLSTDLLIVILYPESLFALIIHR